MTDLEDSLMKSKYELSRHRAIESVLSILNVDFIKAHGILFCGGTRLTLENNEYRESLDIDFVPKNLKLFSDLRQEFTKNGARNLFIDEKMNANEISPVNEFRIDRYGIRFIVKTLCCPVKFEIFSEDRLSFSDAVFTGAGELSIPATAMKDQFAAKFISNCDRVFDRSTFLKDFVDLSILMNRYPELSNYAFRVASDIYGEKHIRASVSKGVQMMQGNGWAECIERLNIRSSSIASILNGSNSLINSQFGESDDCHPGMS